MPDTMQTAHPNPLGLYIHWPFCESKCPYCDFNSHVAGAVDGAAWRDGLLAALEGMADLSGRRGTSLRSIFIGGGTPSLMPPAIAAAVIARAKAIFAADEDMEVTMEANPSSTEAGRLADFAAAGVNRLSLGMQSLDDDALRFLGRRHSAGEALAALEVARAIFPRLSADFIYALPGETPAAWAQSLARILALGLHHLSLYQLTIERGTAFYDANRKGRWHIPAADTARALFDVTRAQCAAAGLGLYEVSNCARDGAACRHNLLYWRGHDWLGIGPGAIGRFTKGNMRWQTESRRDPDAWLGDMMGGSAHTLTREDPATYRTEILMMGLRLAEGVEMARLEEYGGGVEAARLAALCDEGLVETGAGRMRLTHKGMPLLNAILAELA